MKIDEAKLALAKVVTLKTKNRRRELAFLRRGPRPENQLNCLSVVSEYVYPKSVEDLTACAEVLSSFIAGDCENGSIGFGRAMALLKKQSPSAETRIQRVLSARNVTELGKEIRPVLTLLRRSAFTPDYAQLLADAANFSAWRDGIVARWSVGFYRGSRAETADEADSRQIEGEEGNA